MNDIKVQVFRLKPTNYDEVSWKLINLASSSRNYTWLNGWKMQYAALFFVSVFVKKSVRKTIWVHLNIIGIKLRKAARWWAFVFAQTPFVSFVPSHFISINLRKLNSKRRIRKNERKRKSNNSVIWKGQWIFSLNLWNNMLYVMMHVDYLNKKCDEVKLALFLLPTA